VTALIAWPASILSMEARSKIRWQHRLNREHPTCTERKSLLESADGRVATVATRREKNLVQRNNNGTYLTPTGLLMEGDYTQNPRSGVNE
jgi:hypothetical protein